MVLNGPNPGLLTTDLSGMTIQSDGTQWWVVGTIAGTIPPAARGGGFASGTVTTGNTLYGPLDPEGHPCNVAIIPASGQRNP